MATSTQIKVVIILYVAIYTMYTVEMNQVVLQYIYIYKKATTETYKITCETASFLYDSTPTPHATFLFIRHFF